MNCECLFVVKMPNCKFCSLTLESESRLLDHTVQYHKHEPGFFLKCGDCGQSYKSLNSLRMHLSRHPSKSEPATLSMGAAADLASTSGEPTSVSEGDESCDAPASAINIEREWEDEAENDEPDFGEFTEDDFLEEYVCNIDLSSDDAITAPVDSADQGAPAFKLLKVAAQLLMHIKENCNTTQKAIDEIVKGVDTMIIHYNSYLQEKLLENICNGAVSEQQIEKVFAELNGQSLFEGVKTAFLQRKFVAKEWKGTIKPHKVILKKKKVIQDGQVREIPEDFGYVVPFLQQLECLLQCDDVLYCVDNPRLSLDSIYRTVLDGSAYKCHPVVEKDPKALAISIYVDDIQPTDSLSSKQGQKLRTYYWTLCNIYPELRSSLKAVNILSVVKADVAKKYQNRPFLQDFVNSINQLASPEGVNFCIKGDNRTFHGILLFCVGDTPASANLGGFKESSKFAKRPCRQCLITQEDLFSPFEESEVTLRSKVLHSKHLAALEAPVTRNNVEVDSLSSCEEDEEDLLNLGVLENPSRDYGINFKSILSDIHHADVTKMLPQDIMHVIGEGVLELGCRIVLRHTVVDQNLPLSKVNDFLENLHYGHLKPDKPSPIARTHLDSGLRQNACQMFLLARLIPFIVKIHCREDILRNFIRLLMITSVTLSYEVSDWDAILLKKIIKDYLLEFKALFPGLMTPKMHFFIHLPSQVTLYGPLIQQWAMRFEAFHSQLKRLARTLHNMVNLSYSLTTRMLYKRALEMESSQDKFLYPGHAVKIAAKRSTFPETYVREIVETYRHVSPEQLEEVSKINYFGAVFMSYSFILIDHEENLPPTIGIVCQIYKCNDDFLIVYRHLEVKYHCSVNGYEIISTEDDESTVKAVQIQNIHPSPLFVVRTDNRDYVLLLNHSKPEYQHFLRCSLC